MLKSVLLLHVSFGAMDLGDYNDIDKEHFFLLENLQNSTKSAR